MNMKELKSQLKENKLDLSNPDTCSYIHSYLNRSIDNDKVDLQLMRTVLSNLIKHHKTIVKNYCDYNGLFLSVEIIMSHLGFELPFSYRVHRVLTRMDIGDIVVVMILLTMTTFLLCSIFTF